MKSIGFVRINRLSTHAIAAVVMACCLVTPVLAGDGGAVAAVTMKVHEQAALDSKAVAWVKKGETVQIIRQSGRFSQIKTGAGQVGFLETSNLQATLTKATLAMAATSPAPATPADSEKSQEPEKSEKTKKAAAPAVTSKPLGEHGQGNVDVGVSGYQLHGALPGKFQEHRDVPHGLFLERLDYTFVSPDSPYSASVKTTELGQRDEWLRFDAGRVGQWSTGLVYDEIPHFYANSHTLFANTAPGLLQVSPDIRSFLQSLVDAQRPPGSLTAPVPLNFTPAFYDAVRGELALAPVVSVSTKRRTIALKQSFRPSNTIELHAQGSLISLKGIQPLGMGTFARQNNILTPTAPGPCSARPARDPCDGQWESLGVELPAPVDSRTLAFNTGFSFFGRGWNLGADYDISRYLSGFDAITYENPFRITDASGDPPGSAVGRNRQVLQQHAAYPDNTDKRFTLRGVVDLPYRTQLRGLTSWAKTTQDQQFLPYTLNTALRINPVGGSVGLNPATFDPTDPAVLPQQNLNGRIDTVRMDYSVVSRPVRDLTVQLQFRRDDQDNKSPSIVFPGMTRFGESNWVTSNDYYGNALRNFPTSFTRTDYIADVRWDMLSHLSLDVDYDRQIWVRTFRDVPRTTEDAVRARIDFRPSPALKLSGSFLYGDRRADLYKTLPFVFNPVTNTFEIVRNAGNTPDYFFEPGVPLESPLLRRYDEDDRKRKDAKAQIDFHISETATFSASTHYRKDDYKDAYTASASGLNSEDSLNFTGNITVTPTERSTFHASYSWNRQAWQMSGLGHLIDQAVPGKTACCAQYPIDNTWVRLGHQNLQTINTGANYTTEDQKTVFDFSYAFSYSKERIHSFNPYTILPNSPRTAAAYDYPNSFNKFHELVFSVTRVLRRGLRVGAEYRYEYYFIDDFYLNNMSAYPQGNIAPGGFTANLPRQIFLNARYGNYDANQLFVFVKYEFGR